MVFFTRRESDKSTVAIKESVKVQVAQQPALRDTSRQSTVRKAVTFDVASNVLYNSKALRQEDCNRMWFNAVECQEFKENARTCAIQILNTEKDARSNSYITVMQEMYDMCVELNGVVEEPMSALTLKEHKNLIRCMGQTKRLGLESYAVRSITGDKMHRRKQLVTTVLKGGECDSIRKNCHRISRVSGLFARLLAEALAINEQQENYSLGTS